MLSRSKLNFGVMRWLWYCILRFWEFTWFFFFFFFRLDILQNNTIDSMNSLPSQILVTWLLTACIHMAAPLSSDWPKQYFYIVNWQYHRSGSARPSTMVSVLTSAPTVHSTRNTINQSRASKRLESWNAAELYRPIGLFLRFQLRSRLHDIYINIYIEFTFYWNRVTVTYFAFIV